ncbi:hypothetical protein SO802_006297 [Lithocarpus litseifolius]|uniref:Reverse transcriptase zinc-binding domain-containing protein n=1 Tax=Lithocarpus litseifolius TaxID=425828 RepID=A0AAW2DM18_9ROSI
MEADLILKIPLSPTNVEDKLIWPHVPNGVYTMRFGYRFLVKDKLSPSPSPHSQGETTIVWSRIWGLSVPNKVKIFLWRARKEALPVKKNLVRRRVIDEDVCCHCNLKAEDGYHALWDCFEHLAIWEVDTMWLFCRSKKFSNFFELARFVLEKGKQPELFASITWTIWSRRNQLRTSNKPFPLSQVIPSAKHMLQEFTEVQPAASLQTSSPQRSRPKWEPPPPLLLKINLDGVVFKETEEAGLGVVVRDSHGKVIASLVKKIKLPSSSDEVEALAAVRAITFAMDLNLPSFVVEGDLEVVISSLREEEESFLSFVWFGFEKFCGIYSEDSDSNALLLKRKFSKPRGATENDGENENGAPMSFGSRSQCADELWVAISVRRCWGATRPVLWGRDRREVSA